MSRQPRSALRGSESPRCPASGGESPGPILAFFDLELPDPTKAPALQVRHGLAKRRRGQNSKSSVAPSAPLPLGSPAPTIPRKPTSLPPITPTELTPSLRSGDRADALATLGCPAAPAARPPGRPWVGVGKGSRGPWRLREEGSGRGGNTHARRWCRADSRGIFLRIIAPPPTRPAPLPSPPISPPTSTTIPTDNLPSNRLPPIIPTSAAPHTWHSRSKASRAPGRQAVRAPRFSAVRAWLEPECTDSPSRGVPLIRGSPAVRARFQIRGRPDAIATART